ncbi:MmpS family transport accessory protein [Gandjariella thermophila]|uniref:MmpS family membrane protein n=1 Tax=Gandjariella thermophila TaxID=1931992 RepID=A0A4D4JGZ2_9PSEU|nr:MmpS family transport accessory protein [Gandjariella thermophila]GDY33167.1 hypothetical protein GTS_48000 [Gandjariella thermophila]
MSEPRTAPETEPADSETEPVADAAAAVPATTATESAAPPESAGTANGTGGTAPPIRPARRLVDRTWWLPWLLGIAVLVAGVGVIVTTLGGSDAPRTPQEQLRRQLPITKHTVSYEVRGPSKSPEIRYVTDGTNNTEKVAGVPLPWRKEFTMTVGPGPAIVQVLAANGQSDAISCSVSIDGHVVNENTAPGQYATVSCSGVIQP